MKYIIIFLFSFTITNSIFSASFNSDIKTIELKLKKSDKIVIKLMFRNGSVSDPKGKEGLTYLTAGLITGGGSKDFSYNQIRKLLYPMAAEMRVNVDKEVSIFTFTVHKDFAEEFYKIIKSLILYPAFSKEDFERLRSNQQIYVDQVIRASSDEEYSKMALESFLFRNTPYAHMVQGKSESVMSLTPEDVSEHYKKFFTRKNLIIGIAGNYTDDFLERLKKDLGSLPDTEPSIPEKIIPSNPKGINVEIISKDAFGSAIFFGFPMELTRANDEFAALMVANSYLGEHRKSYGVLYDKIRTTRSMNYGDYSYIEWYDNGGANMLPPPGVPRSSNYFSIWIRPVQIASQLKQQYPELSDIKIGHAHFAIRLAIREIDKLIKEGISKEDFEATREFLISYIKLYIQSPSNRLGYLMDSEFYGRKDYIAELDELLKKLSVDDVNKAIRKYWQTDNMYMTIVTDKTEAEELLKSLLENRPSPMSYSNLVKSGLPAQVLNEDEEISEFRLNIKTVNIIKNEDTFK